MNLSVRLATAAVLLKAYENGDATVKDKLSGIVPNDWVV